jgi:hypothetical protein
MWKQGLTLMFTRVCLYGKLVYFDVSIRKSLKSRYLVLALTKPGASPLAGEMRK